MAAEGTAIFLLCGKLLLDITCGNLLVINEILDNESQVFHIT
jgi:hypothetical protein